MSDTQLIVLLSVCIGVLLLKVILLTKQIKDTSKLLGKRNDAIVRLLAENQQIRNNAEATSKASENTF